ncbi:MAG: ComEC/Rec2 family competence protein [Rickettsiaceae bacterium H1]|nr:ComEC/Rec2 family competence protein [Rickettsiaceae bacterium H1]
MPSVLLPTAPVKLYSKQKKSLSYKIDMLRNYVTKSFIDLTGKENGNIAAALIVGKRQGIEPKIMTSMRKAGLAHLIAISGLHLTIVTFFFFILFRKVLALSLYLATEYEIKKWAALFGISASFFYLIISGMSISAQRAFIMVTIMLIAIIIDRNASTMRSVAVAATIVLLLEPESIFKPSFQMSFAAVIGLCAFYESYRKLYVHNLFYRVCSYFSSVILSSIIASCATAPYTIYHFNYFSLGGIIANLVAIPLTTFLILPLGIITTILIPFHLAFLPSVIMSQGISLLIYTSKKVSNMPYSSFSVHTFDNLSIFIITFGFLWLCLWQQNWRFLGIPIFLSGMVIGLNYKTPDILVNEKTAAVKGSDNNLYFLSKQRKNFINKTWIAQNGQDKMYLYTEHSNSNKVGINCSKNNCKYFNKGKSVLFLFSPDSKIQINNFDYVIQLKEFPIEQTKNLISFDQVKNGYFLRIKK